MTLRHRPDPDRSNRVVATLAVLVVSAACASSRPVLTFDQVPSVVRVGQVVTVVTREGTQVRGAVTGVTADAIELQGEAGVQGIEAARVTRVTRRSGNVGRGVVLGCLGGLLIGVAAAQSGERSANPYLDSVGGGGDMVAGVLLGGVVGAGLGALIRSDRLVYEAPNPSSHLGTANRPDWSGLRRVDAAAAESGGAPAFRVLIPGRSSVPALFTAGRPDSARRAHRD